MTTAPAPTLYAQGYQAADRHAKAGCLLVLRNAPDDEAQRRAWLAGAVAWVMDAQEGRTPPRRTGLPYPIDLTKGPE